MAESVTLIIESGEKVKVSSSISKVSELIKSILDDSQQEEIPVEQISKQVLDKILHYCEKCGYSNQSHISRLFSSFGPSFEPWQQEFLDTLDDLMLKKMIAAADYLQMTNLLYLLLAYLSCDIKNKTVDELLSKYQIEEPLTDEVEEEMLMDYPWVYSIKYVMNDRT